MQHKENMHYSRNSKMISVITSPKSQRKMRKVIMRPLTPPESLLSRKCYQQINSDSPAVIPLSKLFLRYENLANLSQAILTQGSFPEEESITSSLYTMLQVLLQDAEVARNILLDLATTAKISQRTLTSLSILENALSQDPETYFSS